jgi:hypothetical protein
MPKARWKIFTLRFSVLTLCNKQGGRYSLIDSLYYLHAISKVEDIHSRVSVLSLCHKQGKRYSLLDSLFYLCALSKVEDINF